MSSDGKKSPAVVFAAVSHKEAKAGTFMVLSLDSKKKLEVKAEGVGFSDFKGSFPDTAVAWGIINVHGVDVRSNVESVRTKIVLVNWVGPKVGGVKRSQALSGKAQVQKVAKGVAITLDAEAVSELTLEAIGKKLLSAGGAHKPTFYSFGEGTENRFDLNFYDPKNK